MRSREVLDVLEQALEPYRDTDLGVRGKDIDVWHMLGESGLVEPIGVGGSRIVVGIGDGLVAKIDVDPEARTNRGEHSFWRDYGDELPLAPVLELRSHGRILVMPRAEVVLDKSVPPRYRDELREAMEAMQEAMVFQPDKEDWQHIFNWGVVDGRVVCIDYGS